MKAPILFFFGIVLMMSPAASAWELPAPLNIINEKVFDGDWSIADKQGSPVKNVKSEMHIRAWIDIIGFKEESIIDHIHYVNGTPRSLAIVKRDAWHTEVPGVPVFFGTTCRIIDTEWDNRNDTTTAIQEVTFIWKKRICTSTIHCYWKYYYEGLIVTYTTDSPEIFDNSIDDYEIIITSYNNSVTPYTLIYVPDRWNIIKQSVEYKTDTASWYNLTGLVKKNDRGTEHVRFLNESGFIIDENETITRRAEYFVINEAPLDWSMLNISVFTPYIEKTDSVCNITIYNSKPTDFIAEKTLMIFIGILLAFFIGICIASGRIKL